MKKSVFLGAAILTIIVIALGVQIGIMIENSRVQEVRQFIEETEILFSDARLQSLYYSQNDLTEGQCNAALQSNLEFNEKIYQEGVNLERYESTNRIVDILPERKRYALLQMQFWLNAERIRKACNFDYFTVIYLFEHNPHEQQVQLDQKLTSATLLEVKEQCGAKMMLSPIPVNLELTSVNIVKNTHGISSVPAVIVNDAEIISGVPEKDNLIEMIGC